MFVVYYIFSFALSALRFAFLLIFLPEEKEFGVAFSKEIVGFFGFGFYGILYGAFNEFFCLFYEVGKVNGIDMVANKQQIDKIPVSLPQA